jgi:hypothetical protein
MPNGIAYLALLAWPLACLVLFRTQKVERALIWSILGGYLFLPPLAEFNLPLVPGMDKVSIPNLSVLLILMFAMKTRVNLWPHSITARFLVIGLILSAIPTVLTNGDAIIFEVLRNADPIVFLVDQLPGQSVRDIGSVLISQILTLVPFLLARQFLSSDEGLKELLLAFMVGGLVYSVPSLIEIRLSPQMNVWVYGFFQHSFEQTMRAGGFRPIVFLPHGLWVALFVCISVLSCAALTRRSDSKTRARMILALVYLFMLLVLCKSFAAVLAPVVLFAPYRWQIKLAAVFAVIAVVYPMLRNAHFIPLEAIVAQFEAINPLRAQSLEYRFNNEEQLLARAAERPLFGWGGWGRSLVRHSETGEILSIPDGRWIIVFGTFGWLGYVCEFGLLALPLVLMAISLRRVRDAALSPWVGPLALILGITMMDMLLNATLTPLTWLTAGAILGHAEKRMPRPNKLPNEMRGTVLMDRQGLPHRGKRTVM